LEIVKIYTLFPPSQKTPQMGGVDLNEVTSINS